jgi:hypothetical protein
MNQSQIIDLYTDYLLCTFSKASSTVMSQMLQKSLSHDQITRFLSKSEFSAIDYWHCVKHIIREIETDNGILIVDDFIEEKPYTDENDIVCYHYDHSKGINIVNFLYCSPKNGEDFSLPVAYRIVSKTQKYIDPKTNKQKRKSDITKNEILRDQFKTLVQKNKIKLKYILFDIWFSSKENMEFIKVDLKKDFACAIKNNRTAALSYDDKRHGQFIKISDMDLKPGETRTVYLKGLEIPVIIAERVFTNKDHSIGELYLVSSDIELTYRQLTELYQKRWNIELFHKSIKQNAALEKSPTRTQSNHIFCSMLTFIKLRKLRLSEKLNHFAFKSKIYLFALKASFSELLYIKEKYAIQLSIQF